ncbi:MAG: hypothetical protein N4A45_10025 [Flavobacteriales bacterium]|jgi:hypothetical protein|nr:hypothetical protein [Flavobacteriales bacterium]
MKRNKIITFLILIFVITSSQSAFSQSTTTEDNSKEISLSFSEVGLRMHSFNKFGMIFKLQKDSEDSDLEKFYRLSLFNLGFKAGSERFYLGAGLGLGKETRMKVDERLEVYYGPEISATADFYFGEGDDYVSIAPAIGYILGVQYQLSKRMVASLETIPRVSVVFPYIPDESKKKAYEGGVQVNAGWTNQVAALSFIYQIGK